MGLRIYSKNTGLVKVSEWVIYEYEKDYLMRDEEKKVYRTVTGILSKNKGDLSDPDSVAIYPVLGREGLKKEMFVQVEEVKDAMESAKNREELGLTPGEQE